MRMRTAQVIDIIPLQLWSERIHSASIIPVLAEVLEDVGKTELSDMLLLCDPLACIEGDVSLC